MSIALHSRGLLDVLSTTPDEPSVTRLVSMPVCAASLRNLVRKAGYQVQSHPSRTRKDSFLRNAIAGPAE